jgi:leucine dehydrogenase
MWGYADAREALRDALRLSRAMTYKSAVADLPLGGGKGVIMTAPGAVLTSEHRTAALLDFGDTVQSLGGRYITAEDVGTSSRDMRVIAERTGFVAGLPVRQGGSGDPSPFTALGVEAAIRACCERVFSSSSLGDRTVAVIGLGHVGSRVAKAGAKLVVSDIDQGKHRFAEELGAGWATPAEALELDVDVVAPCALGGVFDHETVPRLRCRVIAGAANNQLANESVADLLAARKILWAPDFVANAGGLINIAEEQNGYNATAARRRVRQIGDTLRQIFDEAAATDATPLTAATAIARKRLAT